MVRDNLHYATKLSTQGFRSRMLSPLLGPKEGLTYLSPDLDGHVLKVAEGASHPDYGGKVFIWHCGVYPNGYRIARKPLLARSSSLTSAHKLRSAARLR
jgi:hypothetical protein